MNFSALSSRARREVLDAVDWISQDNPVAARAFLDAVGAAIERIETHPEIGVVRRDWTERPYRFVILASFSYIIAYGISRGRPRIVRVVHSARDLPRALRNLR